MITIILEWILMAIMTIIFYFQFEGNMDPMENQLCRVCEEKAAGFHFGAFTCEGCKSFFGRFCNNQTNIPDCKNNYECVVDKRNRTACKACRLRKCLAVGMSKSGCRYGRRSNWFKIHCLMQKKPAAAQQKAAAAVTAMPPLRPSSLSPPTPSFPPASYMNPAVSMHNVAAAAATFPAASVRTHPSSRSPSPLNTSSESSGPSPAPEAATTAHPFLPFLPFLPPTHASPASPPSGSLSSSSAGLPSPLLDPLSTLYRLSPLMALSPALLLQNAQKTSDFHEQLRLLAERRALFEASCAANQRMEAAAATAVGQAQIKLEAADCQPIDLSVK